MQPHFLGQLLERHFFLIFFLLLVSVSSIAQTNPIGIWRDETSNLIAAILYTATAIRIAAEKRIPDAMAELRTKIDHMSTELIAGKAHLKTELANLEEKYIAALQARDSVYAREIYIVRSALEQISLTPRGKEVWNVLTRETKLRP
jgi:hypothetical protein